MLQPKKRRGEILAHKTPPEKKTQKSKYIYILLIKFDENSMAKIGAPIRSLAGKEPVRVRGRFDDSTHYFRTTFVSFM